jgi:hypothetical protein
VALSIHAWNGDRTVGICIGDGESVDSIRDVVEGAVGPWAHGEYIEMHVDGLEPQLATSAVRERTSATPRPRAVGRGED